MPPPRVRCPRRPRSRRDHPLPRRAKCRRHSPGFRRIRSQLSRTIPNLFPISKLLNATPTRDRRTASEGEILDSMRRKRRSLGQNWNGATGSTPATARSLRLSSYMSGASIIGTADRDGYFPQRHCFLLSVFIRDSIPTPPGPIRTHSLQKNRNILKGITSAHAHAAHPAD